MESKTPEGILRAAEELQAAGRYADAAPLWRDLAPRYPDNIPLYLALARSLEGSGNAAQAIAELEALRANAPLPAEAESELFMLRLRAGSWDGFDTSAERLLALARAGAPVNPSTLVYAPAVTGDLLLRSARACAHVIAAAAPRLPPAPAPAGRIRVGYLSVDYRQHHPVGRHMLEVFRRHDRDAFEVFGYDLAAPSHKSERFAAAVDHMRPLHGLDDAAAVAAIRADGIEVLVELGGYHADARLGIPARRPAPVQVNFLGYGGTTGADFIDYIIGDSAVIPSTAEQHFSEAIVRLPVTYFPGYWARPEATPTTRAELGLPEEALVFCAFAANAKINPPVFALWLDLLKQTPGSVLWLRARGAEMASALRRRAQDAGVEPGRLVFAPAASEPGHLGRLVCADLFLDTFPYSAGSTAADLLWAGVPVLTRAGDTFLSRMAASIVRAAGTPELVASDPDTYRARALALAGDRTGLTHYREQLIATRGTSPLFDAARFTRDLEAAYAGMSRRLRAGVAPAAFTV